MRMKPQKIPVRYLFHGSKTELPVGGLLLPPSVTGVLHDHDADRDKVYLSTDVVYAVAMATENGEQGWLYRARPLGPVEEHYSDVIFNGRRGVPAGGTHYTTTKAKIIARAAVPKAFAANRGPLIKAHFTLLAALSSKADVFTRKLLNGDEPDDPAKWLITRGEDRWEQTAMPWEGFQDVDDKRRRMLDLHGRLYKFLEDRRDEILDVADEIPDVMRELLDLLDFRIDTCAECGWTLNDADVRRGNGFCITCESQQSD
jgi:hypothetical protein